MARESGLRAGPGPNPGRSGGIPTPVSWNRVRGGGIPESGSWVFQNPLPLCPSVFGSYPGIPRPDRDETQQAGRTGATPPCRGLLVMGSGPGGAPAHPRLGVAPVRFIPAGRLGFSPKRDAGRAGTGAGNWSQDRNKTGAENEPRTGRRAARAVTGKTVGG